MTILSMYRMALLNGGSTQAAIAFTCQRRGLPASPRQSQKTRRHVRMTYGPAPRSKQTRCHELVGLSPPFAHDIHHTYPHDKLHTAFLFAAATVRRRRYTASLLLDFITRLRRDVA